MIPKRRKPERMGVRASAQLRSPSHLRWVRGHFCAIAGKNGHICEGRIEAAHVRTGTDGGMGVKPSDNWSIPLCSAAHIPIQHQVGEAEFERRYGLNMKQIAQALWAKSPHRPRS